MIYFESGGCDLLGMRLSGLGFGVGRSGWVVLGVGRVGLGWAGGVGGL